MDATVAALGSCKAKVTWDQLMSVDVWYCVLMWSYFGTVVHLLWLLQGAGVTVAAVLSTSCCGSLVFLIYKIPLIIMCDCTLNTGRRLLLTHLLYSSAALQFWVGRSSNRWRLICCREKYKFCCLFKHFQTRLTISVHISVGWCQCFCSGHVIIGAHFSLWKKKRLGLKLKESDFYRLLEKDLFSDLCPT